MAFDVGSAVGYLLLDASGWTNGLSSAKSALKTFSDESATLTDKATALGKSLTGLGTGLTTTVTTPLVGLGASAVKTAANFESAMSQVQATLGITKDAQSELNGETVNTMESLEALAKELGASTKFSASEAAEAINNMAMAGYKVQEVYDTLPGVLNLASAGALDLDYATQLVANGLNVMGLGTESATELADKLAVTASNAYGSVSDFGEGLLVAGAQASLANVSLTDTMTALGILGDNGISASEGGTYLRNTLKNLYTPTTDAAKALNELGVRTQTADGRIIDFQDVLQDLGGALDNLTEGDRIEYMSRIFDTRTISAANALIANSGERWNELAGAIDNAGGAAEQMAETQLDNLEGKLTIFKSAMEGLMISFGELLLPVVTDIVEGITGIVDWLNSLDEGSKKIILTVGAVIAALGPLLIIVGKVITAVTSISTAIAGAGGLTSALGAVATAVTGPLGIAIAAVAAFAAAWVTNFGGIRDKTMEIMSAISTIISSIMGVIRAIWDNDLFGIRTVVEDVFGTIQQFISDALDVIVDIFNIFAALFTGDWEGLWEALKALVSDFISGILNLVGNLTNLLVDFVLGLLIDLGGALNTLWEGLMDVLAGLWETLLSWLEAVKEDPIGVLMSIAEALYELGRNLFQYLWDGLKDLWDSIVNWVQEKIDWLIDKVKFWDSESKKVNTSSVSDKTERAVDRSIQGSYASGLDYVPRDMDVRVHEGERIVTREENRNGFFNDNTPTFPEILQFDLSIPLDGDVVAHAQYQYNVREGTLRGDDLVKGRTIQ